MVLPIVVGVRLPPVFGHAAACAHSSMKELWVHVLALSAPTEVSAPSRCLSFVATLTTVHCFGPCRHELKQRHSVSKQERNKCTERGCHAASNAPKTSVSVSVSVSVFDSVFTRSGSVPNGTERKSTKTRADNAPTRCRVGASGSDINAHLILRARAVGRLNSKK